MQHRSRSFSTAIVTVLGTALALLAGPGLGEAHAAHAKVGPYELPSAKVQCTYSGRALQKVTVPPAEVSMDKALYRAGRRSQYVGIAVTLQGEKGGAWHGVAKHGGTGHRKVAYSVKTHVRDYQQIPSVKKRSMLTFTDPSVLRGYSHYRVRMQLFWYAANGRKIRGKVSRILPAYSTGASSCAAALPSSPSVALSPNASASLPGFADGSGTVSYANGALHGTLSLYRANTAAGVACATDQLVSTRAVSVSNGEFALNPGGNLPSNATPGYYRWGFRSSASSANKAVSTCSGAVRGADPFTMYISTGDGSASQTNYALGKYFTINVNFANYPYAGVLNDGTRYIVRVYAFEGSNYKDNNCLGGAMTYVDVPVTQFASTPQVKMTISSKNHAGYYKFQAAWISLDGGPESDPVKSQCALERSWGL